MNFASSFGVRGAVKGLAVGALTAAAFSAPAYAAWEPAKPVEFVVPAGTGGGADQMARLLQGIVIKHKLMNVPLIVVNKSGGSGAEGFLAVKGATGDAHKIIITLSNLFTTPLATGVPFSWRDMTPVSMLALDQFVLWTNAEAPYKNAKDFAAAVKAANGSMKMGGTGSKQEDQLITVGLQKAMASKFIYVPFKGGGEVAVQLVGGHINSSVNNPAEAVAQWRAGKLNALCVFDDERMPYKTKVTPTQSWNDIPTCKEAGIPTNYTMLRGIFMPAGVTKDQLAYYENLMKKIVATPEWKEYMEKGAFSQTVKFGADFNQWLVNAETEHKNLMKEAGFLAKSMQ
jgi:tripartite-type tricarboxylate transporter receptor subunit TctC